MSYLSNNSYIRGIYTQAFEMNPTSLRCVDSWVHDTEDDDDVQAEKPRYFQRVMDAQPMLKVPKWVVKALGGLPPYTETLTVDTQTGKIHGTAMPGGVPVVITIDMGILAGRSPDGKEMGAWYVQHSCRFTAAHNENTFSDASYHTSGSMLSFRRTCASQS